MAANWLKYKGLAATHGLGINMSELHRITSNPAVLGGKPTVRGLRMSVSDILDLLAAGADRAEILSDYLYLEDGDITAALEYASRSANHTVIKAAE
jgi:uncharacterized protein (DUF433 family)